MTAEPVFRFPVIRPTCREETLSTLKVGIVAAALISGRPVRLYAQCHDIYWDAHPIELDQVREYLSAPWVDAHCQSRLLTNYYVTNLSRRTHQTRSENPYHRINLSGVRKLTQTLKARPVATLHFAPLADSVSIAPFPYSVHSM